MYIESGESLVPARGKSGADAVRKANQQTSNNKHVYNVENAGMVEGFENFDFAESSDRHALFLIVHKDTLESDNMSFCSMHSFMYLAEGAA